ncbi:MAG: HAMP domain-containing histidine kinase [Parasporobacterium sp.]|nr:HAMP domain-containing histidine kinase [Parasporobacterium sp.]
MRFSIRKKTALYIILLIILAFGIGLSFCAIFANRYFTEVTREEMCNAYNLIRRLYVEDAQGGYFGRVPQEYKNELTQICEENGFSMLIVSPSGIPAFTYGNSDFLYSRLTNLVFSRISDIVAVLETGDGYTIQTVRGEDDLIKYIEMWGFLYDGSSFIYRSSYMNLQNNINVSMSFYVAVCAMIFLIFAVIILLLIKSFTEPLKRLAEVTVKVNEGEFETRYESRRKRNDEIGVLSENVYEMAQKLEKSISALKSSNLNLQNELKAKEKMEEARKKYMSDVSHELKTPIALISSYAEGLKEGIFDSSEDRDYYCDVIIDEAEKMNLMVKKLSTLNQLEQGKSAVTLERFNVIEVIDGFLKNMSVIIEEKQAHVTFNNTDIAYVWSDEFLFEDVLVNYFNNALNHMDEKKCIKITVEKVAENIRVTVFNTGSNIPEEELPKLWDKFYKVDKARTREYGGSGLGLSIVKAIADSLNKECGVYNTPDGVAFYIELESAGEFIPGGKVQELTDKSEKHGRERWHRSQATGSRP